MVHVTAIEQDGLFDQTLAHDLREEVDVFLRAAGACCEMVNSCDGVVHG
jgi:hypothetical protein